MDSSLRYEEGIMEEGIGAMIQREIERSPASIAALGVFKPPDQTQPGSTTMAQQNEAYTEQLYRVV